MTSVKKKLSPKWMCVLDKLISFRSKLYVIVVALQHVNIDHMHYQMSIWYKYPQEEK